MVHSSRQRRRGTRGVGSPMALIRATLDTVFGLGHVLVIGARSGFRASSPYLGWRSNTAFGASPPASVISRLEALLAYARWTHRIRRGGR